MKKRNKIAKLLFCLTLTCGFISVFKINNVKAVSGSSIIPGSSKSGTPGAYDCSNGFNISANGGFTGFRLTVVKTKDKEGNFGEILHQADYIRKGNYKYAKGQGGTVYINKKSEKCKTRFGLINAKLVGFDEQDDCQPKWEQVDNNKNFYNSFDSDHKTTLLTGDYNWDKVAAFYNKKAADEEKTIDLLNSYGVNTSKYTQISKEEIKCQLDDNTVVSASEDETCKQYICPTSNLLPGTKETSYNPNAISTGNGACVSYGPAPTYVQPKAPSGHTYSNFNSSTGTYTDTWIEKYEYSCSNGHLSGTKCLLDECTTSGSHLEADGQCRSCRLNACGNARKDYTQYINGHCYNWSNPPIAKGAQTSGCTKDVGVATVDGSRKVVDATKTPVYKSVTRQATEQKCSGDWVNTSAGVCAFVHGHHSYTDASGKKVKSVRIEQEEQSLPYMKVCAKGEEELQYIWMIIEPMFTVATGCGPQKTYYGTATEIATLVNKKSGFSSLKGDTGMWGGFLYMVKDSFKNADGADYKFSKLISATSEDDFDKNGWYKSSKVSNMYSLNSNGKVKGAGVGIVWLGNARKNSSDDCKVGYFCDNDPTHSIQTCVSNYWNKGKGYSVDTAVFICNRKECDEYETCEHCDDDGREDPKTYSDFPTDFANALEAEYNTGDKKKNATTAGVTNIANTLKTNFRTKYCTNHVFESKTSVDSDDKSDKFTCKNYYKNEGTITVGTTAKRNPTTNSEVTSQQCETAFTNRNGTFMGNIGNCKIYCKESAKLVFPGNVKKRYRASDSFEWPSKLNDSYKLQIDYSITCTAINPSANGEGASCGQVIDKDTISNAIEPYLDNSIKLTYQNVNENPNYNLNKLELKITDLKNKEYKVSTNGGSSYTDVTSLNLTDGHKIQLRASYRYYLPDNLNFYQDKVRNYYNKEQKDLGITPLTYIGVGRLATENIPKGTQRYRKYYNDGLQLNVEFGNGNSIGSVINDYKCDYNVYQSPKTGDCICPDDTWHEGESLDVLMACSKITSSNQYKLSCTSYQRKYCNKKTWDFSDSKDDTVDLKTCKCDNCKNETVNIEKCVNETGDYEQCYYDNCVDDAYQYCESEIEQIGVNSIAKINYCYTSKKDYINQNKNARVKCDEKTYTDGCPECNDIIVYRTIDVENPFPGNDGKGKTTAFSLNKTKGRYPGLNWDDAELVKNKITNARDKKGNDIYKLKDSEALYSITLTPSDIKKIRDINKNVPYDSYTGAVTCDLDSEGKCTNNHYVARLLRNTLNSDKINGLCGNANSSSLVEQCYEKYSSSAKKYTYSE